MKYTLIIIQLFFATYLLAQDEVSFTLIVPDTVPPQEVFNISFILKNAQGKGFDLPELKGLQIVGGPNFTSSHTFINGTSSSEMSYTYRVKAKEEGNIVIPSATVFVDDKPFKTEIKNIPVIKGYKLPISKDQFDDFFIKREPFSFPRKAPGNEEQEEEKTTKKKKKKTYRI